MNDKTEFPLRIQEEDGPFEYVYLSIAFVPGIKLPTDSKDSIILYRFPEFGAQAFLTNSSDDYIIHMHRSDGIAYLLLTGLTGHKRFGRISVYWNKMLSKIFGKKKNFEKQLHRQTELGRKKYIKQNKNTGSYLIYRANGKEVQPNEITKGRRIGNIGFGIDIISGKDYRELHKASMHATATALSLSLLDTNCSPKIEFGRDIIYFKGNKGLRIYPRSLSMGTANIFISSPPQKDLSGKIESFVPKMLEDRRLQTAIALYIESQKTGVDNLRAFISIWSALELLINRLSKKVRPKWNEFLEKGDLPEWDKNLKNIELQKYRQRDRFFSVACVLSYDSVKIDTKTFNMINDRRSAFYHQKSIDEKDLPTVDTRSLFQKYLKLGLNVK
jgi:hypothetical protein